ncbi:MAG: hypothetical protein HUK21_03725, partial [Fibrobacteraceae bacterium]|nr:hypothetical protein [Fibrobacteraceae bacterium]
YAVEVWCEERRPFGDDEFDSVEFYFMCQRWEMKMDDDVKLAEVTDSVEKLRLPFFNKLYERTQRFCEGKYPKNDSLKEISNVLLAWYTKNGWFNYFVQSDRAVYRILPCEKHKVNFNLLGEEKEIESVNCHDKVVEDFCVDTRGTKFKGIILTEEDKDALDEFSGCDRWKGETKVLEDRYNKAGFMPIEISHNAHDMCFDYGSDYIRNIHLDMEKGRAVIYGGCTETYLFEKKDGVWKFKDFHPGNAFCD